MPDSPPPGRYVREGGYWWRLQDGENGPGRVYDASELVIVEARSGLPVIGVRRADGLVDGE